MSLRPTWGCPRTPQRRQGILGLPVGAHQADPSGVLGGARGVWVQLGRGGGGVVGVPGPAELPPAGATQTVVQSPPHAPGSRRVHIHRPRHPGRGAPTLGHNRRHPPSQWDVHACGAKTEQGPSSDGAEGLPARAKATANRKGPHSTSTGHRSGGVGLGWVVARTGGRFPRPVCPSLTSTTGPYPGCLVSQPPRLLTIPEPHQGAGGREIPPCLCVCRARSGHVGGSGHWVRALEVGGGGSRRALRRAAGGREIHAAAALRPVQTRGPRGDHTRMASLWTGRGGEGLPIPTHPRGRGGVQVQFGP